MFEKIPAAAIRELVTLNFVVDDTGNAKGDALGITIALLTIERHAAADGKKTYRVKLTINAPCYDDYAFDRFDTFTLAEFKKRVEARAYIRAIADFCSAYRRF